MERNNNEVVIIGGDHHNTLSVIRSFGRKKLLYKILIHSNEKEKTSLLVFHSRFGKNLDIVDDNEGAIYKWLIEHKSNNKKVIITCSDLAEFTVDNNYNKLANYYYIPGFNNQPGMVTYLMDKFNQKKWADTNNIPVAKSWRIDLTINKNIPRDIIYPCIVKPNISAFGKKSDIAICKSEVELGEIINKFKNEKYIDIIIQEFITKQYEVCALGAIIDSKIKNVGAIIKKDRENPPTGGGSLTFAHFIDDKKINLMVSSVIDALYKINYRGLYDIEFLICEDSIYLNEINFRNSGNNYALCKNGIDAPYIYYLNTIGKKVDNVIIKKKNMYFMDEINEYMLVKKKYIKFRTFIKEFLKAYSYAKIDIKDFGIILFLLKRVCKGKIKNE